MLPILSLFPDIIDETTDTTSFRVTLSEPSLGAVTVKFRAVQDGTASVGRGDLSAANAQQTFVLTIPAGQTQAIISYVNDRFDADEFDENFTIELSDPVNAVLSGGGPVLQATGVILDSDGGFDRALFVSDPLVRETDGGGQEAVFEVRLSEPFSEIVTLDYATADGTARAGQDYVATSGSVTFLPGQTVTSVAVPIVGDTASEGLETFSLVVTPNVGIANGVADAAGIAEILDDDAPSSLPEISISANVFDESTDTTAFRVTLSEPSLADVTVQYQAVQDGSATIGRGDLSSATAQNVFTLTIPAGQTQALVTYTIDRFDADELDENFTVELSNPTNAVLSGGEPVVRATGVILDSDGGQNTAVFVSDPLIFETDGAGQEAAFEIRLSRPVATTVTLNYATADGTARAGQDYRAATGAVTFAPGQTVAAVAVDIIGDTTVEGTETFSLVLLDVPNFIGGEDTIGIASIQNDDVAPTPTPSPTPTPTPTPTPAQNVAPVARDDGGSGFRVDNDAILTTGSVLSNDSDADGDALSVASIDRSGLRGDVQDLGGGRFRYDPDGAFDTLARGETAEDSFVYRVSDGDGGSDTARVTITVAGTAPLVSAPSGSNGTIVQGSNADEVIRGNDGNNILVGFGGQDVLTGLDGRDVFVLSNARGAAPNSTITDFGDEDVLAIDDQLLGLGSSRIDVRPLTFDVFLDVLASGRVGYDRSSGELRIDTDRDGSLELVATLEGAPRLTLDDVLLF